MLAHYLRRWTNINSALVQRIVFDVGSCTSTRRSQTALDAGWPTAIIYLQPQDIYRISPCIMRRYV